MKANVTNIQHKIISGKMYTLAYTNVYKYLLHFEPYTVVFKTCSLNKLTVNILSRSIINPQVNRLFSIIKPKSIKNVQKACYLI